MPIFIRSVLRLAPPVLLSAATATLSLTLGVGLIWPDSWEAQLVASFLPIAEVHQHRADQALGGPDGRGADWELAKRETVAELHIAPTRARPWMRLAFIDAQTHNGVLTDAGVADIQHGYDFTPFDREIGPWRLAFVYNHWDQLTPSVRGAALDETEVLWRGSSDIQAFPNTIPNPAGRLAATMALANLKAGFGS